MSRKWWPKSWRRFLSTKQPSRKASRPAHYRPFLEVLEDRLVLSNIFIVSNTSDSGTGSLRQAIMDSNATTGPNTIDFNIGSGVQTINLLSALPTITNAVTIDGSSQPGFTSAPLIVLNGSGAGSGANGLTITAGNSTVEDLAIDNFTGDGIALETAGGDVLTGNYIGVDSTGKTAAPNGFGVAISSTNNTVGGTTAGDGNVISGNNFGVAIVGSGTTGNAVQGNYIGTDNTGAAKLANTYGVIVAEGAANNTVGGTAAADLNVLSGNSYAGVQIQDSGSTGNVVDGNYIGTDKTGLVGLANGYGVYIYGSTGNTVGAGNVLAANIFGVAISSSGASGNVVQGNYIGTDKSGAKALGNAYGVYIENGAANNVVGGTTAANLNVLSGNTFGAVISGSGTTGNVLEGNYIGTDLTGTKAVANTYGVVVYSSATNNVIGGTTTAALNVISGNTQQGAYIDGSGTTGNVVEGNYIGTDLTGAKALANTYGVFVSDGAASNTVGGTTSGALNVISGNSYSGVQLAGSGTSGNVMEGNYIGTDKTGLVGLGNGAFGVAIIYGASGNVIGGTTTAALNVISANTYYGVEIIGTGASGNVVEGNYIGTDKTGAKALPNSYGVYIASGSANNTVGGTVSGAANVLSGNTFGVVVYGSGSSGNVVEGNYVGTDVTGTKAVANTYGVYVCSAATNNIIGGTTTAARNIISANSGGGVYLTGSGVSGNVVEGNYIGTDESGTVRLGNGTGVVLGSASNTVGGTVSGAANVLSGNSFGVVISGSGVSGNVVEGNYIGTDESGTKALANTDGVYIYSTAANNTVGGTTTAARNIISANTGGGVYLTGSGTSGNVVQGNYIGTDTTGTANLGNANGVFIENGAAGSTVGGTVSGAGNVISANTNGDVYVTGSGSTGNVVEGNYLGTNKSGTASLANGGVGVDITSANNTLGGTTAGARNVISDGVVIGNYFDGGTTDNVVEGNYIGTDVTGTVNLGNGDLSIYSANNTVGGTTAGARNVISPGVTIATSGGTGNVLEGNYIGTDATGTKALGNGYGVDIDSSANTVGGTTAGARNIISGVPAGVVIEDYGGVTGNVVEGNYIGTDVTGTKNLGNAYGVYIEGSTNNTVGGTTAGAGNVIAYSSYNGVEVDAGTGTPGTGNAIRENIIYDSGNLGIYLNGGNNNQVAPVLTSAITNGTTITINGSLSATANTTYALDFFADPALDKLGNAEGQQYLGSATVTTNASGTASFTQPFNVSVPEGYVVSATATDPKGNTSAFAKGVTVFNLVEVINTNDSGAGSLRAAIANVNGASGPSLIDFAISGTGAQTINLASALPPITNVVTIEGSSENTFLGGSATTPLIVLDGSGAGSGANGLTIAAGNSTVEDLAIDHFNGDGIDLQTGGDVLTGNYIGVDATGKTAAANGFGVYINAANNTVGGTASGARNVISDNSSFGVYIGGSNVTSGNVVEGNYIGTDDTGTANLGNGNGVFIGSANNTVGGTVTGAGNVISANTNNGVGFTGSGVTGNVVEGNYIGTDATGTKPLGNGYGVVIYSANNTVGGTMAAARNVISSSTNYGMQIGGSGATDNMVEGNYIGTDVTGTVNLGNSYGVVIYGGADNNSVGGMATGAGNVIAYSTNDGVNVNASTGNVIRQNSIHDNGKLGIHLVSGGNNNQAAPVLTSATTNGSSITIVGTLTATPSTTYNLDFFATPSGSNEGQQFLGTVPEPGNGSTFSVTFTISVPVNYVITATATDPNGNTSEFSVGVATVS